MGIAEEMCYSTTTVSERRRKRARARPDKTEDRMDGGEEDITPGYITFHVLGEVVRGGRQQENPRTLRLTHSLVYLQKPITICIHQHSHRQVLFITRYCYTDKLHSLLNFHPQPVKSVKE